MPDFTQRSSELELMDAPDIPADEIRVTLDELTVINSVLGGYAPSLDGISSLLPDGCRRVRILDVARLGFALQDSLEHKEDRRAGHVPVVAQSLVGGSEVLSGERQCAADAFQDARC